MSDTNNGKYNIDDLVNSLLLERQSNLSSDEPAVDVVEDVAASDLLLLDPVDESEVDLDDTVAEELLPLID